MKQLLILIMSGIFAFNCFGGKTENTTEANSTPLVDTIPAKPQFADTMPIAPGIPNPSLQWKLSKKTAHPEAAKLMNEDWFWSETDELAPFGDDDGWNGLLEFKNW